MTDLLNGNNSSAHVVPRCKGFVHSSRRSIHPKSVRCSNFRCSCSSGHYCVPLSFWQAFCGVSWCRVGRFCWFPSCLYYVSIRLSVHDIKYSRTYLDIYGISYMHAILYVMCCFSFCLLLLFTSHHCEHIRSICFLSDSLPRWSTGLPSSGQGS